MSNVSQVRNACKCLKYLKTKKRGEMLEGSIVRGVCIRLSRTMFLLRHSNSKLSSGELYTNLTKWHTLEGLNQVKYKLSHFIEE